MTVPDRQFITNNLLTMLAAGTGKQVGDHKAPAVPVYPYSVLYVLPGGEYWGAPLIAPDADVDMYYQVDSIGARRDQVEWLADRVRRTMLARTSGGVFQVSFTNPTGWKVADRVPEGGPGGVQVEGSPPNEVFSIPERFALRVVPA